MILENYYYFLNKKDQILTHKIYTYKLTRSLKEET